MRNNSASMACKSVTTWGQSALGTASMRNMSGRLSYRMPMR